MTRREMLTLSTLFSAGCLAGSISPLLGAERSASRKKILFFTKSSGFEHSVIKRPVGEPSSLALGCWSSRKTVGGITSLAGKWGKGGFRAAKNEVMERRSVRDNDAHDLARILSIVALSASKSAAE